MTPQRQEGKKDADEAPNTEANENVGLAPFQPVCIRSRVSLARVEALDLEVAGIRDHDSASRGPLFDLSVIVSALQFTTLHHIQSCGKRDTIGRNIGAQLFHRNTQSTQIIMLIDQKGQVLDPSFRIVVALPSVFQTARLLNRNEVNEEDSCVQSLALKAGCKALGRNEALGVGFLSI